jgi:hypothetical protein
MVSSISSSSTQALFQAQTSTSSKLTDDQKSALEEILAKYDVEEMTDDEKKSMMDEMKSTGIPMTSDTKEIMDAAGFTPPEKPQGPPPEESTSTEEEIPEYLKDFIEKQQAGEVTQEDIDTLVEKLQASGETVPGALIDTKA